MLGFAMIFPLLPFYALDLNISPQWIGVIIASFSLAQLMSAPLWGRVSDRFGRRPALLIGLTASAISYVVFGFANSFWLLLVSRVIQGAGGGRPVCCTPTLRIRCLPPIEPGLWAGCRPLLPLGPWSVPSLARQLLSGVKLLQVWLQPDFASSISCSLGGGSRNHRVPAMRLARENVSPCGTPHGRSSAVPRGWCLV